MIQATPALRLPFIDNGALAATATVTDQVPPPREAETDVRPLDSPGVPVQVTVTGLLRHLYWKDILDALSHVKEVRLQEPLPYENTVMDTPYLHATEEVSDLTGIAVQAYLEQQFCHTLRTI